MTLSLACFPDIIIGRPESRLDPPFLLHLLRKRCLLKKEKVKIIIQDRAPLQFPEVTFARKAKTTVAVSSPNPALQPCTAASPVGDRTGGSQDLGPSPPDALPAPKTREPTPFPSQLLLGTGHTLTPL